MSVEINLLLDYVEENMMKAQDSMQRDFAAIRTGKASPALVRNITVDYYGTPTETERTCRDCRAGTAPAGYSATGSIMRKLD